MKEKVPSLLPLLVSVLAQRQSLLVRCTRNRGCQTRLTYLRYAYDQTRRGSDLVRRLAGESDPVCAVNELVWNSLDADHERVDITIQRNEAGGVVGFTIHDDGLGMSPERVEHDFRWVGTFWEHQAQVAEGSKRPLHGPEGQWRLRCGNIRFEDLLGEERT